MKNEKPKNREIEAFNIMTKPVEAVRMQDSIHEVARLFTEKHFSAAAVLDGDGKPIGVITKTDLVRYEEEKDETKTVDKAALGLAQKNNYLEKPGFHMVDEEDTVEHWMTPVIFSVKPETPMKEIARRMVKYGVHHIFVKGRSGELLVGIVSSFDILKQVAEPEVETYE